MNKTAAMVTPTVLYYMQSMAKCVLQPFKDNSYRIDIIFHILGLAWSSDKAEMDPHQSGFVPEAHIQSTAGVLKQKDRLTVTPGIHGIYLTVFETCETFMLVLFYITETQKIKIKSGKVNLLHCPNFQSRL